VREAFNSPFRPFVLATTSIGQEGLDFHPYCHVVYHWNLPSNPVDLEQREGRVHRYKGHAIRKNVARRHGLAALKTRQDGEFDPWEALFDAAAKTRPIGASELVPYWLYEVEGGAKVERRVPLLPFSREEIHLERLKRSLALYRLVFGQPRQEDLLNYLDRHLGERPSAAALDEWRISLAPPSDEE
jgi:superfamily II DNA/RNA helicase